MTFKDRLRLLKSKFFGTKTILFSKKIEWETQLRDKIKCHDTFFYEFDQVDPNLFDIIIPLSLDSQKYLNKHKKYLIPHKAIVPSDFCIDLCNDKLKFYRFLIENNFNEFAPSATGNHKFPYILKKNIGEFGIGTLIIKDENDEKANNDKINSVNYFTQEYIDGAEEYTAHIICVRNRIIYFKVLMFTFSEKCFVKGKHFEPVAVEVKDHNEYKEIFENILLKMDYQGICCFNYKTSCGVLIIFEINPRFGGSLTRVIDEGIFHYMEGLRNSREETDGSTVQEGLTCWSRIALLSD